VVEVRFRSQADWQMACEAARAESLHGPGRARRLALRLQQLAAMQSSMDIEAVLGVPQDGDRWLVPVDEGSSLVVSSAGSGSEAKPSSSEIIVIEEFVMKEAVR
jgi:hypothetical protein